MHTYVLQKIYCVEKISPSLTVLCAVNIYGKFLYDKLEVKGHAYYCIGRNL